MTRRILNDDPQCLRQDNCRAAYNLCQECSMAAGVYKLAARKGNADPDIMEHKREVTKRLWADPEHRALRIAAMARARQLRASDTRESRRT